MRTVNCIICGSSQKRTLEEQHFEDEYLTLINPDYQRQPRRLVVCEGCGFVYHDPQLDQADADALYAKFRDASFRNETPDAYFDRITSLLPEQSENHSKVMWIRQHASELIARNGTLLDIGCGGGVFIHTFLQHCAGWQACGVEPTIAFAELAGRRLGEPVLAGNYRSGLFPGKRFDLISINQVLEHVLDPVAFLKDVRADLADAGHVYIEVPDVSDFAHLLPTHDRFLMQHLWVFSKNSLSNVCQRAGFEVKYVEQQVTVRGKRNLVALLSVAGAKPETEMKRDDVDAILSMRQRYLASNGMGH